MRPGPEGPPGSPLDGPDAWRPLRELFLMILGALVAGALLGPHVFNGLLWLGRNVASLESFRAVEIDSVSNRATLLFVVIGLVILGRRGVFRGLDLFRVGSDGPRWKKAGRGYVIGVVTMSLIGVLGWLFGNFALAEESPLSRPGKWAEIVVGSALIGFGEELLFRGILFGLFRRVCSFWQATFVSSGIFSLVHFAKPEAPVVPVTGEWTTGLEMIGNMFYFGHASYHYFPFCLTLFGMGVVLCLMVERSGSLWEVMGLHAGWVLAMRIGGYVVDIEPDGWSSWLFGYSDVWSKSAAAAIMMVGFITVYVLLHQQREVERRRET